MHLYNALTTLSTARAWLYQQNRAFVHLHEKQATMARQIEVLESQLVATTRKSKGEQEMEERNAQGHGADSNLAQPVRWLMQGGCTPQKDDVLADEQRPRQIVSADSFATAFEENHSSAETVTSSRQLSEEVGRRLPRRTKRKLAQ
jgi:hypothetical protein